MKSILGSNIRLARLLHGLSLADLGERLGKSKQYLSRIETGAEQVSATLERDLVDELGVLPAFFRHLDPMPITEEQCHFRKQLTTKVALRQYARARGELLKRLVCVLDRHLELPSYNILETEPTSEEAIERGAERCRSLWGLGYGPISNITRIAENAGAVVMRVNGLAAEVDAVSFATQRPVIALNGQGKSACRARFGIAHELGHFALHTGVLTGDRLTETQANRFASALLLPRSSFLAESHRVLRRSRLNWEGISELKIRWGVSKAALLYRGKQLGVFSDDQMRSGYITLKRHGEAIEENEDSLIPQETPEIVSEGIQVLSEQLSIPIAAVSREMHVQPKLLNDLLGISETNSTTNVVNLFN
ncbi:helix-turn-helix domain-containing protein [Lysobacter antibioticus]|uniref:helix-turn-helix domain-containing protein n=1 Tax=Lysobacter antibioticus TaxID=84531 RepID=UPI0009E73272|nr:XRE family transcriptional regulator [Lysobacter antibioticus]